MKFTQKYLVGAILLFVMANCHAKEYGPQLFIVDSWTSGFIHGLVKNKENRWKLAWKKANSQAKNDLRIWGGLFVSDTNLKPSRRFGEVVSRHTYQFPQTAMGFTVAQFYNTVLCKVNTVSYGHGSTVLNMEVKWTGICFGNYILAKNTIQTNPNNKIFQHEYGHYLQSKRMGYAYLIRVGLPAIMSKGDHDAHPVELDCNREGFLYFNKIDSLFQNDSLLFDKKGWNFSFNPFPDSISVKVQHPKLTVNYINYQDSLQVAGLEKIRVKPKWYDYVSWTAFPIPLLVGIINAKNYNDLIVKSTRITPVKP
jgi:hypothetical protein